LPENHNLKSPTPAARSNMKTTLKAELLSGVAKRFNAQGRCIAFYYHSAERPLAEYVDSFLDLLYG
jgi:hypothetical protein